MNSKSTRVRRELVSCILHAFFITLPSRSYRGDCSQSSIEGHRAAQASTDSWSVRPRGAAARGPP